MGLRNGPAGPAGVQLKEVKCEGCGETKRKPVRWEVVLIDRLNPKGGTVSATCTAWFCLGCGHQLDEQGGILPENHKDRLTAMELDKLGGAV